MRAPSLAGTRSQLQDIDSPDVISVTDDSKSCLDEDMKTLNIRNNIRYTDA